MRKISLFVRPLLNLLKECTQGSSDWLLYFAYKNMRFDGGNEIDCNFAAVLLIKQAKLNLMLPKHFLLVVFNLLISRFLVATGWKSKHHWKLPAN